MVNAGAICGETQTKRTYDLDLNGLIDMLEPQPERPDPDHPGQTLPARAGAVIIPIEDYTDGKTAYEKACRMLGKRCMPEFKNAIKNMIPSRLKQLNKTETK